MTKEKTMNHNEMERLTQNFRMEVITAAQAANRIFRTLNIGVYEMTVDLRSNAAFSVQMYDPATKEVFPVTIQLCSANDGTFGEPDITAWVYVGDEIARGCSHMVKPELPPGVIGIALAEAAAKVVKKAIEREFKRLVQAVSEQEAE